MAIDALPLTVAGPELVPSPGVSEPVPSLPDASLSADASVVLPVAPLSSVELAPVPSVGRLLRLARATLGVLAHPYPRRAPRPPLTREEHIALAQLETARLERERQAYRTAALGGSLR